MDKQLIKNTNIKNNIHTFQCICGHSFLNKNNINTKFFIKVL